MLFTWLQRRLKHQPRFQRRDRTARNVRPRLEALEGRWVPSVIFHEFPVPTGNSGPHGIATGPDGNLWFTEQNTNHIGHVSPSGTFVEVVLPTSGIVPFDIVAGPDANMWFTEQAGNAIGRIGLDATIKEYTIPTTASGPTGITVGPDGNLWFTEQAAGKIGRITPTGTFTEFSLPRSTSGPTEIATGPDGRLWFTEQSVNQIGRITTAGAITEFALPSGPSPNTPSGITPGPDGNVWFTEAGSNKIARITPTGTITEFTVPTLNSGPKGIILAPDGSLYFAETNASKIGAFTPAQTFFEFAVPTGNSLPTNVTIGPDGNLWFNESNTNKIADLVLPHPVLTSPDKGGGPDVRLFEPSSGAIYREIFAYNPSFTGGVRVAYADVNHDNIPDIITAPGPGGGPDVRVFDGATGVMIREYIPYTSTFTGGLFVAGGDVNEDGYADIIVAPDAGMNSVVRVLSGKDGSQLLTFFAYATQFTGGARVAAGDVNGDGHADIITGAGPTGGPHVEAFSGVNGTLLQSFLAYNSTFLGGVNVAAGDVNGDGKADIITGAGAGGGPHVKVFSGVDASLLQSFFAYDLTFTGGVRVGTLDINGDNRADILTGPGSGGGPQVKVFDGVSLTAVDNFFAYSTAFQGGVFVGSH